MIVESCRQVFQIRMNPRSCDCKGSGWLLSQIDTYHPCRLHNEGASHPEDDHYPSEKESEARRLAQLKRAYTFYADGIRRYGVQNVRDAIYPRFTFGAFTSNYKPTPEEWVDGAEQVFERLAAKDAPPREEYFDEEERARGRHLGYDISL